MNKGKFKKLSFISLATLFEGIICGVLGSLFANVISIVTEVRSNNFWLVFLLPIAGLLSVFIFKICRTENEGTSDVIKSVNGSATVSMLLLPAVFIGSALTHLCGGSAGREGAALQMGGSISSIFARIFKLDSEQQNFLTVVGMSGFFSALFGTPFGAFVFAIEVVRAGKKAISFIIPTLVSSVSAYGVVTLFKVKPERFPLEEVLEYDVWSVVRILLISVLGAFLSLGFCKILRITKTVFKKYFENAYLRILIGGVMITVLTLIVGTTDYNGGGIDIIEKIFTQNSVKYEAFLLKIIFTAITVAAGFKGGEIIPTFFIGATFGGALASILGLSIPLGAAVGMAALFCGVTKCPIATCVLAIEMFGAKGIVFYILSSLLSYLLSGKDNLYGIKKGIWM